MILRINFISNLFFGEHIYDIIKHEKPEGVIVQLGGQTALKLAEKLDRYGIKIIGTSFKSLDPMRTVEVFSTLLKDNDIPYPEFGVAETAEQALSLADELDFPILVRPSYVLGGQGMKIVINKEELETHVVDLLRKIPNNKLLLDHYLDGAIEAEADAICDGENIYIIGIMERHRTLWNTFRRFQCYTSSFQSGRICFATNKRSYPQNCTGPKY